MKEINKAKLKRKSIKLGNTTILGLAQSQKVQVHGEAASQIIQAYKGVRYNGKCVDMGHHGRSLKGISKYKINSNHEYSNYKQQAGFSAELIKEARDNKEAIFNGDPTRTRTTDGIGKTNDQRYDHVKVDAKGNVIEGSGSQMKVKGKYESQKDIQNSSKNIVDQMVNDKKWEKYSENTMDLPSEQAIMAREYASEQAKSLREAADQYREAGNIEKAKDLESKADQFEKAGKKIRDSKVKSKEAVEARKNPEKFVAKEVLKDSHSAGKDAAKSAFLLGGAISISQNIYSVIYEDKSLDDAAKDILLTTGAATITGYGVGAMGTAIKATLHSSKNIAIRNLGTTSAPVMIATAVVEVSKSITKYAKGEINEIELLEELGERGTGIMASAYGSAIGTAILPGIGTIVGGMVGYTVSSLLYKGCITSLKDLKLSIEVSEERREIIEKLSSECIVRMKQYQEQLIKESKAEFKRREDVFNTFFNNINQSLLNDNMDLFFSSMNGLGREFGIEMKFETFKEFDEFMMDEDTILTL